MVSDKLFIGVYVQQQYNASLNPNFTLTISPRLTLFAPQNTRPTRGWCCRSFLQLGPHPDAPK